MTTFTPISVSSRTAPTNSAGFSLAGLSLVVSTITGLSPKSSRYQNKTLLVFPELSNVCPPAREPRHISITSDCLVLQGTVTLTTPPTPFNAVSTKQVLPHPLGPWTTIYDWFKSSFDQLLIVLFISATCDLLTLLAQVRTGHLELQKRVSARNGPTRI